MKKIFSLMVIACFVFVVTGGGSTNSFAAGNAYVKQQSEVAERFSLGAEIAYYAFGDEHDDSEVQGAPVFKIVGEYAVSENLAVNTKLGYISTDVEDAESGMNIAELYLVPLELNMQYQVSLLNNQLVPYIGGGIAYNFVGADVHNDLKSDLPSFASVSLDANNCWGGQLFIGIDYIPMDNLTLGVETGYSWAEADIDYSINALPYYSEAGTAEVSLDSWTIAANVAYRF